MPPITRWVFALHRYIGTALCVPMLMWCLSGIVMMYVPYPSLSSEARLAGLAPIDWRGCCVLPAALPTDFTVEMMAGRPLLFSGGDAIDLRTGNALTPITSTDAEAVARGFAQGNRITPGQLHIKRISHDQWTVESRQPLYRVRIGDAADTTVYVSSKTRKVVQSVTRSQRFWNYLGAVPHWIYFTSLRERPALWTQVVIWTSLTGTILTVLGLYIGVRQWLRARRADRWSPYSGINWWHHVPGLVFGVFLLTWVFSGLLSMNPWGLLEGAGGDDAITAISGQAAPADVRTAIQSLRTDASFVNVRSAVLHGQMFLIATDRNGVRHRLDVHGNPSPITAGDAAFIAKTLSAGKARKPSLLPQGDDYYFRHDEEPPVLPVWRVTNAEGDRYYIDPMSGEVVARFGAADRGYRWLFQGFHRLDFVGWLRARPLWDGIMLILLCGSSLLTGTGLYLGVRYLGRMLRL